MGNHHDHSYKLLFSHPQMLRDLLEGFIRQDWLGQLDYDSLEKVNGSYITDDLRARADDVIWRVRWGERCVYLYLLLEFQSREDPHMAVRILTYVGLLYQDLIHTKQLDPHGRLPPVLPIVLYNGGVRWGAAQDLTSLIEPGPPGLEIYQPQARYLLIDEGCYQTSELPLSNLVAALFRLENSRSRDEIDTDTVLAALVEWLRSPEQRSLSRAFALWIGRIILPKLSCEPVTGIDDLQEMRTMLADRIQEWGEEFKREGLREGEAQLLLRQLRRRFGELPVWVQPRLQQAPSEQLERWGERLLEVDTLDALFED
ncbi:Rpn family recombination-promoting nuclease/putative transposase [Steroidobacter sp. S1-65]|uniref:Rpn family recombination-promoting nuclease/putative transposase n=1 Tax=Steroidobacter gossypii TaxID=2805490 RepID=A0ABS1X1K1_9GAMM|nr:Rpn family recombination-promoting nuclease/putative transposase [Steroidobacter gossypii]MBM0107116.1 Rpn family recombination-promoting nuclease/putative transposase [Steroidobacter gossypii]